ncbi:MAG: hypothetical protein ACYC6W_07285 [Nitrosotalea sp.]
MKPNIEISSLSVNKLRNSVDDFIKYDIDLALDEVENSDLRIKLKYKFTLLSNPTNIKIITEGIASLSGPESEISKQLEPDQRNIPIVVNTIYQEIFPFIYMISKSMQIPCPAYKLSQISATQQDEIKQDEIKQDEALVQEQSEKIDIVNSSSIPEDNPEPLEIPPKSIPLDIVHEGNANSA